MPAFPTVNYTKKKDRTAATTAPPSTAGIAPAPAGFTDKQKAKIQAKKQVNQSAAALADRKAQKAALKGE